VSLGNAANSRVARHLRDEIDVEGEERGVQAHARASHGSLASGMTGAHHHNVVGFSELQRQRDLPQNGPNCGQ